MGAAALCREPEVDGLCGSSALSFVSCRKTITPAADPSCREISPVGQTPPTGWNIAAFRRSFPEIWGQYLKDRYKTAYRVQKAFPGIDSKTARDWIGGKRDPSASFVVAEIDRNKTAMETLGGRT